MSWKWTRMPGRRRGSTRQTVDDVAAGLHGVGGVDEQALRRPSQPALGDVERGCGRVAGADLDDIGRAVDQDGAGEHDPVAVAEGRILVAAPQARPGLGPELQGSIMLGHPLGVAQPLRFPEIDAGRGRAAVENPRRLALELPRIGDRGVEVAGRDEQGHRLRPAPLVLLGPDEEGEDLLRRKGRQFADPSLRRLGVDVAARQLPVE